ncbi:phosphoadenosine phosphosulfate reductase [Streptomyces griseocarneus]|nr:phosphoadenosine phosphosulfate reductase [Streptomyces griseocarneus]
MASHICRLAAKLRLLHRVVIVHADLGDVEWEGTRKLAEEQARRLGVRFEVVKAEGGDLLARTVARFFKLKAKAEREAREQGLDPATAKVAPAWPSSSARWCTSDLKRGPVRKLMTRLVAELGDLGRPVRILNCLGQRAAESAPRAKLAAVEVDRPASNGKRHVTTWRPIHGWTDAEVWKEIARSGLPYHEAYDWGMSRLSCSFCVLGCEADVVLAARLRPAKAAEYVAVEKEVRADFKYGLSMREIVERAAALEAERGELRRPPRGAALARYVGKKAARAYLVCVERGRLDLVA